MSFLIDDEGGPKIVIKKIKNYFKAMAAGQEESSSPRDEAKVAKPSSRISATSTRAKQKRRRKILKNNASMEKSKEKELKAAEGTKTFAELGSTELKGRRRAKKQSIVEQVRSNYVRRKEEIVSDKEENHKGEEKSIVKRKSRLVEEKTTDEKKWEKLLGQKTKAGGKKKKTDIRIKGKMTTKVKKVASEKGRADNRKRSRSKLKRSNSTSFLETPRRTKRKVSKDASSAIRQLPLKPKPEKKSSWATSVSSSELKRRSSRKQKTIVPKADEDEKSISSPPLSPEEKDELEFPSSSPSDSLVPWPTPPPNWNMSLRNKNSSNSSSDSSSDDPPPRKVRRRLKKPSYRYKELNTSKPLKSN